MRSRKLAVIFNRVGLSSWPPSVIVPKVSLRNSCDGGCGVLRGRRLRYAGRDGDLPVTTVFTVVRDRGGRDSGRGGRRPATVRWRGASAEELLAWALEVIELMLATGVWGKAAGQANLGLLGRTDDLSTTLGATAAGSLIPAAAAVALPVCIPARSGPDRTGGADDEPPPAVPPAGGAASRHHCRDPVGC